jgi:carboxypeptidase Q
MFTAGTERLIPRLHAKEDGMRTRDGVALAVLLTLVAGCTQLRPGQVDRLVIGEVMMNAAFSENLRQLAVSGGRLSGTENATRAEAFIAERARAYGLSNVHFEPFAMESWISEETVVTLLDPPQVIDGAIALGNTESTPPEGITGVLIDVGRGKEEEFRARAGALQGAFALAQDGGPRRADKLRWARERGAVGLVVMAAEGRNPIIGNGHATPRPEPAVVIPHDPALLEALAAGAQPQLNVKLKTRNWHCTPRNVVAEIPGQPAFAHQVVIVCAHLDSWHLGEGAIDNGNGSATILEVARALSAIDWQPRRTVRFIWFMAEELGLAGSAAYVAAHADELPNIVAVINVDMPGSPRRFGRFGGEQVEPLLKQLVEDLRGYELQPEIGVWSGSWSDHAPFVERGVPAISLAGDLGPGVKTYHTAGDVYDVVDRRGTIPSAAVLGVLVRRLADVTERPTVFAPPQPAVATDEPPAAHD